MTKSEAREYALKVLSTEVRHHAANGSEWLEIPHGRVAGAVLDAEGKFSEADHKRIKEAVGKIADGLGLASLRLARSRVQREARKLKSQIRRAKS